MKEMSWCMVCDRKYYLEDYYKHECGKQEVRK